MLKSKMLEVLDRASIVTSDKQHYHNLMYKATMLACMISNKECVDDETCLTYLEATMPALYKRAKNEFYYKDYSLDASYIKQMVGD